MHISELNTDHLTKRRRVSASPGTERRGVNLTPRWSREPPSPFTSEVIVEARSQGAGSRKRGATPLAYHTPHSNSNVVAHLDSLLGDGSAAGDTEADANLDVLHDDHAEEEWHGVEDTASNGENDGRPDSRDMDDESNDGEDEEDDDDDDDDDSSEDDMV